MPVNVLGQIARDNDRGPKSPPAWTQEWPACWLLDTRILYVAPADADYNPLPGRVTMRRLEPPPAS